MTGLATGDVITFGCFCEWSKVFEARFLQPGNEEQFFAKFVHRENTPLVSLSQRGRSSVDGYLRLGDRDVVTCRTIVATILVNSQEFKLDQSKEITLFSVSVRPAAYSRRDHQKEPS